ncbi:MULTISPECIES: cytochrome c6 PetJ [unclassified Moorena]|uniref:cytochrome c6 PetJ n=1 Tax=unclassified Moorena TaxID=2683338 RepID=UPI00140180CA|nr:MULTISPECIES: c-type cytochrome [unclassified Moorena]NEO12609.1 c-type cytochrome [Moorena sp. SIO3E8]NEP97761.1 c-type cytochrome [Moorena sp. SIO3F7]
MKKILIAILLVFALITFSFPDSALAAGDATKGEAVFTANCNACHMGGNNIVNRQKTLKKEALEKYGKYSAEAIKTQVTNGNGAMPAFRGRLNTQQIEDVAAYVLQQADKGW